MLPVTDTKETINKPKVWIITCKSMSATKAGGWKVNWEKTVKHPGWEEHVWDE